jgi:hypothetical protein
MDDTKLAIDQSRALRAQSLMDDDLLREAFATLEADYIAAWKLTPARDGDGRERLWQAVQIVARVKDHLGCVIENGKLANAELRELAERPKRFGIL